MRHAALLALALAGPLAAQEPAPPEPPRDVRPPPKDAPPDDAPPKDAPPPEASKPRGPPPLEVPPAALEGVEKKPLPAPARFEVGATDSYWVRQRAELEGFEAQPLTTELGFQVERRVASVDEDGTARVVETFRAVLLEQTSAAMGSIVVDTRDGTLSGLPMVDCVAALVGGSIELRVRKDGTISGCVGGVGLVERVLEQAPEEFADMIRPELERRLGDAALLARLQETFVVLPEGQLEPGQRWTRTVRRSIEPAGDLEVEVDHVYLGLVQRDGVPCAKLLVRQRCAGGADVALMELLGGGRASVEPSEGQAAVYIRARDGAVVLCEPMNLAYGVGLDPEAQEHDLRVRTLTRAELLPPPAGEQPAKPEMKPAPPGAEPAPPAPPPAGPF